VGPFTPSLAAGELEKLRGEPLPAGLPEIDIDAVRAAQRAVCEAVRAGALSCAHDIAEGGLAVALAECCLAGEIGARVKLGEDCREAMSLTSPGAGAASQLASRLSALFGEGPGGFLVSGEPDRLGELAEGVSVVSIGSVGGEELTILDAGATPTMAITVTLAELTEAHASLADLLR
jgi:phosphoribosylformylglycinamidine synthase